MKVTLYNVDIEHHSLCNYDYLEVRTCDISLDARSFVLSELTFSRAKHTLPYSDVTIYFCYIIFYHLCFTCIDFYDLSAWGGCLYKEVYYKFLNVCPFVYTAVAGSGKVGPVHQVNHTSWVAVITPTDRPKSLCNRTFLWRCLCCDFALLTFLLVYGLLSQD